MKVLKIIFLTTLCCLLFNNISAQEKNAFQLKDVNGRVQTLAEYKGKWVLVNYWATWCPPCLEEVPDLVAIYDARKDKDVMVIGVAFDFNSKQEVLKYVDDMLMSYPIVYGDEKVAAQIGRTEVLPTTFIYNPRGELVKVKHGLVTKHYLERFMQDADKR